MSEMPGSEQLQLDDMKHFEVPQEWIPEVQIEVSGLPVFKLYKVSAVGQFTVPATARHRWGLDNGGQVNVFDLGGAVYFRRKLIQTRLLN